MLAVILLLFSGWVLLVPFSDAFIQTTKSTNKPGCHVGFCKKGWSAYENYCYKALINQDLDWEGAVNKCKLLGANLASVHSEAENKFIVTELIKKIGNLKRGYWIGMRLDRKPYGSNNVSGSSWSDDTTVDWADPTKMTQKCREYMATGGECKVPWLYGEPYKRGTGKCVHYTGLTYTYLSGTWGTADCSKSGLGAICKAPTIF